MSFLSACIELFDNVPLLALYDVAEKFNCTPLEVLDFCFTICANLSFILGFLGCFFLDTVCDHVADWLVALFRWLRSRRKKAAD